MILALTLGLATASEAAIGLSFGIGGPWGGVGVYSPGVAAPGYYNYNYPGYYGYYGYPYWPGYYGYNYWPGYYGYGWGGWHGHWHGGWGGYRGWGGYHGGGGFHGAHR